MQNPLANSTPPFRISRKRSRPSTARPPYAAGQWWAPLWRGLLVDPTAKHHRTMRSALWIYLYLIVHADRQQGTLKRKLSTIAHDMGLTRATVQYGITKLRRGGYITTENSGRFLAIHTTKWKPLSGSFRRA